MRHVLHNRVMIHPPPFFRPAFLSNAQPFFACESGSGGNAREHPGKEHEGLCNVSVATLKREWRNCCATRTEAFGSSASATKSQRYSAVAASERSWHRVRTVSQSQTSSQVTPTNMEHTNRSPRGKAFNRSCRRLWSSTERSIRWLDQAQRRRSNDRDLEEGAVR